MPQKADVYKKRLFYVKMIRFCEKIKKYFVGLKILLNFVPLKLRKHLQNEEIGIF